MNCPLQLSLDCEMTVAKQWTHRWLTFQHLQLHWLNPTIFRLAWFVRLGSATINFLNGRRQGNEFEKVTVVISVLLDAKSDLNILSYESFELSQGNGRISQRSQSVIFSQYPLQICKARQKNWKIDVFWIQLDSSLTKKKPKCHYNLHFLGMVTTANIAFRYYPEVHKGIIYLNNYIILNTIIIGDFAMTSSLPRLRNWILICLLYLMSSSDKSCSNLLLNPAHRVVNHVTSTQSNFFVHEKS